VSGLGWVPGWAWLGCMSGWAPAAPSPVPDWVSGRAGLGRVSVGRGWVWQGCEQFGPAWFRHWPRRPPRGNRIRRPPAYPLDHRAGKSVAFSPVELPCALV
jgi:hypothetical protein